MDTLLKFDWEVVRLLDANIKTDFSLENVLKSLIKNRLSVVSDTLNISDQTLFELVMTRPDLFVASVPMWSVKLVEETTVLNRKYMHR